MKQTKKLYSSEIFTLISEDATTSVTQEPKRVKLELLDQTLSVMSVSGRGIANLLISNAEYQQIMAEEADAYRKDNGLSVFYARHRIVSRDKARELIHGDCPVTYILEFNVGVKKAKELLEKGHIEDCILRACEACSYGYYFVPGSEELDKIIIKGKCHPKEAALTPRSTGDSDSDEDEADQSQNANFPLRT